jgi:hypothetical protein
MYALFLQNSTPDEKEVAHITVQRTPANLKKIFLELDHYDFHFISKESILTNTFQWKANLLGGGRIVSLLERLSGLTTLGTFLELKEAKNNWKIGEGFIEKGRDPKPAKFITGHKYLPSQAFTEKGIDWVKVNLCKIKSFYRAGNKKSYSPPHLLIKENIGKEKLSVFLSEEYLVFRANIIGIHSPANEKEELKDLESYFNLHSDLLRFYIRATSSQLSISKATVPLKEDFMNLPYPEKKSNLSISTAEKILIKEVLNYQLSSNKDELTKDCSVPQLRSFSKTFCQTLNSVYSIDSKEFRLVKLLDTGKYYALHLEYSEKAQEANFETDIDLDKYIEKFILSKQDSSKSHIQRILKYYSKDTIILAKPKQLRYWLQSIALRDADETFADYVKTGF